MVSCAIFIFNTPLAAQGLTGLDNGMKYFLFGAIAFIVPAFVFAIYFWIEKNKYRNAAGIRPPSTKFNTSFTSWSKLTTYFMMIGAIAYLCFQEYNKGMKAAAAKSENLASKGRKVFDEKAITMADAKGIAEGKKIFTGTCFACHGTNGEGNAVGPNLTDKYWLHGGSIVDVFKTINTGVPDKGMQAWSNTFSQADIRNIASFVLSLQGTNPANAKTPQGKLCEPGNQSKVIALTE